MWRRFRDREAVDATAGMVIVAGVEAQARLFPSREGRPAGAPRVVGTAELLELELPDGTVFLGWVTGSDAMVFGPPGLREDRGVR